MARTKYMVVGTVNTVPFISKINSMKKTLASTLPAPNGKSSSSKAAKEPVAAKGKRDPLQYNGPGIPRRHRIEKMLDKLALEFAQLAGEVNYVRPIAPDGVVDNPKPRKRRRRK